MVTDVQMTEDDCKIEPSNLVQNTSAFQTSEGPDTVAPGTRSLKSS